jgi:hypothetical protein
MATIDAAVALTARGRSRLGDRLLLAGGDILSFLAFAAIGRSTHGEAALTALLAVVATAAPFILGWFVVALPGGAFKNPRAGVRQVVQRTALCWLGAWPLGLALRALILWRGVPISFAIVVLVTNLVFLCGWRAVFAWLMARRTSTVA